MIYQYPHQAIEHARDKLIAYGQRIGQRTWQSIDSPDDTWELLNHTVSFVIPETLDSLITEVSPNLPWAENHFFERVNGQPLNPGVQYANWPHFKHVGEDFKKSGKFSHTYMERYWPRELMGVGIRFNAGDLGDVINLLNNDNSTRQAYLPVWFPEDTGVVHGERVPCTLGYHFIIRNSLIHVNYYIRSCDYIRHFRDDIYMTCRLVHMLEAQLIGKFKPGTFNMHITSLHCFYNERLILKKY